MWCGSRLAKLLGLGGAYIAPPPLPPPHFVMDLKRIAPPHTHTFRNGLWGVITAKIHTPYSIIGGGGGGGGGVSEVGGGGGGGCYAMLQIVARQVQVPFHTNPNLMPYRWKPILFYCGRININESTLRQRTYASKTKHLIQKLLCNREVN